MARTDHRTCIFAIDPGVNGAYAVLGFNGECLGTGELPRFDRTLNATELGDLVGGYAPKTVVIEKVGARPGQGVTSMFTFGCSYGVCLGVAGGAGVPVELVSPIAWKRHFHLTSKPKDASRELAVRLFPSAAHMLKLRKHVGRADALLMGSFVFNTRPV